ncbi:sugar-binding domain-containing protein, partial [Rhizobium ruizarguesonis]
MRSVVSFNEGWSFHEGFGQRLLEAFDAAKSVSLPHTAVELPFSYFDETSYQRAFSYQKVLRWLPEFEGREVSLVFDAAMADSVVYLNGQEIIAHKDGYTPFEARLTDKLVKGENLVTVKIDGSENPDIPPFGGRIDYLTYAGIYRDVWLKVTDPVSIRNLKIETTDVLGPEKSATIRVDIANPEGRNFSATVTATLKQADGTVVATAATETIGSRTTLSFGGLTGIALWDITDPTLYDVTVELRTEQGSDRNSTI